MTLASCFSLSISSSTEERITPAFLLGGSVTWTISKSDLISTFNSSGVNFFMGFDFAFIMLGRVAYLGWFSLRSVLKEEKAQNSHIRKGFKRMEKNTLVKSPITITKKCPSHPKVRATKYYISYVTAHLKHFDWGL